MKSSKDLLLLIKSLSKAEKAYFTRFSSNYIAGSGNSYIKLFKELEKHKADYYYSERELKKGLRENGLVKNFEFTKNYLHKILLRSLNNFYYEVNPNSKIRNNIKNIEVLYKKGLFANCKKILDRTLKQAYKEDNYLEIIELLKWKKNLIYEGVYKDDEFSMLEKTYNEEKKIINLLGNLTEYTILSFHTRSLLEGINPYHSSEGIIKELQKILKHPLLRTEKKALSLQAMIYFYQIPALIHKNLDNNLNAFKCWEKIAGIMEENPAVLKGYFINYIITIYNLLGPCLNLTMYNELENYIDKLRSLEKIYPDKIFENDRIMIFISISLYELRIHLIRGEFNKLPEDINNAAKGLEVYSKDNVIIEKLEFYYLLGYSCFAVGKIDTALEWINKIINDKELVQNSFFYVKSRVFSLILHYELGNFEALEYLVKSYDNILKRYRFYGSKDKVIIDLFRKLLKLSSKQQELSLFTETVKLLKVINREEKNKRTVQYLVKRLEDQSNFMESDEFDFESWLESKITGKRFDVIVKQKAAG